MKDLKVGDSIVVGSQMSTYENGNRVDKFMPNAFGAKVARISVDDCNRTRIDLKWGLELGYSKVYSHDHGKSWLRAEECN